jgi:hypothetical protein
MNIKMTDAIGQVHTIDSADYELIGRWLAEKAKLFMSADTRILHPFQVDIWPSGATHAADIEVIKQANMPVRSADGLLEFIKGLLRLSEVWQAAERTEPGPCYGAACDHVSHGRTA